MNHEPHYLPSITPHDYDTFRAVMGNGFPNTYNEWLNDYTQSKIHHQRQGFRVVDVLINCDELLCYCRANCINHSGNELQWFAEAKARGQLR